MPTSNCHRSTCSPVSLFVITTTSLEIFPPTIHLSSCDMIFLMYALTWSSDDTVARLLVRAFSQVCPTCVQQSVPEEVSVKGPYRESTDPESHGKTDLAC